MQRIDLQERGPSAQGKVHETCKERLADTFGRAANPDVTGGERRSFLLGRIFAQFAQTHEVRVGIEDHQRQLRVQEQLLERHSERVGLA